MRIVVVAQRAVGAMPDNDKGELNLIFKIFSTYSVSDTDSRSIHIPAI